MVGKYCRHNKCICATKMKNFKRPTKNDLWAAYVEWDLSKEDLYIEEHKRG